MELILISDNKLKIMLTEEDMFRYEISADSIDYDNTETRRAFWQILDEAKHRTGFDAASERVFVQVYPSRSGGCEMYVTKLGAAPVTSAGGEALPGRAEGTRIGRHALYEFASFERLASVCERLCGAGYSDTSAAYADRDSGIYYLVLTERAAPSPRGIGGLCFIEEYGRRRGGRYVLEYISEHCICIEPTRAVELISRLK